MPCFDPREREALGASRLRINLLTRLLCYVLRRCEASNQWPWVDRVMAHGNRPEERGPGYREGDENLQGELDRWWEQHKDLDRGRG